MIRSKGDSYRLLKICLGKPRELLEINLLLVKLLGFSNIAVERSGEASVQFVDELVQCPFQFPDFRSHR